MRATRPSVAALALVALGLAWPQAGRAVPPTAGDVAPGTLDPSTSPPTWVVTGNDRVDIADVVVLLRASVGLEVIRDPAIDQLRGVQTQVDQLTTRVAQLEGLLANFSRVGTDVYVTGANLHVVNGAGTTDVVNGLGNVVIGYNESRPAGSRRGGSHDLVIGSRNDYTSYGSLVVGDTNEVTGPYASVTGGTQNSASALGATVAGGEGNVASGTGASVAGGVGNLASGDHAAVLGGSGNEAIGDASTVSGGSANLALAMGSAVSGGTANQALGIDSTVGGGQSRSAATEGSFRAGALDQPN